jgi:hypothetical protein
MTHTPGPWKGYGHTGYVYGPDVVVCRCGDYKDKELLPFNKDRWAADAQLIAAAPDLFNALRNLLIEMGEGSAKGRAIDLLPKKSVEAARQAVAKATAKT